MNRTRNVLFLAIGLFAGYVGGRSVHVSSDERIIEVMADENAALKEKNEAQRKLIETYEAERQELSTKVNPT
jgi:hypothetical protein